MATVLMPGAATVKALLFAACSSAWLFPAAWWVLQLTPVTYLQFPSVRVVDIFVALAL